MDTRSSAVPSNVDINKLPKVYRAVASYIAQTGINPSLLYDLKVSDIRVKYEPSKLPLLTRRIAKDNRSPASDHAVDWQAFEDYIKGHRPKVVKRLRAHGKEAPEHLFLTDDGKPITIEGFQRAFLNAMVRTRLPEITSLSVEALCVRPAISENEDGPHWPHASKPVEELYKPRRPAVYDCYDKWFAEAARKPLGARNSNRRNTED
ncbi:hypothetical protein GR250_04475 [Rhizobium leguminosarum]|nr:hypothetical protein [Rhizobium leguminosarum]